MDSNTIQRGEFARNFNSASATVDEAQRQPPPTPFLEQTPWKDEDDIVTSPPTIYTANSFGVLQSPSLPAKCYSHSSSHDSGFARLRSPSSPQNSGLLATPPKTPTGFAPFSPFTPFAGPSSLNYPTPPEHNVNNLVRSLFVSSPSGNTVLAATPYSPKSPLDPYGRRISAPVPPIQLSQVEANDSLDDEESEVAEVADESDIAMADCKNPVVMTLLSEYTDALHYDMTNSVETHIIRGKLIQFLQDVAEALDAKDSKDVFVYGGVLLDEVESRLAVENGDPIVSGSGDEDEEGVEMEDNDPSFGLGLQGIPRGVVFDDRAHDDSSSTIYGGDDEMEDDETRFDLGLFGSSRGAAFEDGEHDDSSTIYGKNEDIPDPQEEVSTEEAPRSQKRQRVSDNDGSSAIYDEGMPVSEDENLTSEGPETHPRKRQRFFDNDASSATYDEGMPVSEDENLSSEEPEPHPRKRQRVFKDEQIAQDEDIAQDDVIAQDEEVALDEEVSQGEDVSEEPTQDENEAPESPATSMIPQTGTTRQSARSVRNRGRSGRIITWEFTIWEDPVDVREPLEELGVTFPEDDGFDTRFINDNNENARSGPMDWYYFDANEIDDEGFQIPRFSL